MTTQDSVDDSHETNDSILKTKTGKAQQKEIAKKEIQVYNYFIESTVTKDLLRNFIEGPNMAAIIEICSKLFQCHSPIPEIWYIMFVQCTCGTCIFES